MITMPSDSVKEVLGQLIGNFSHAIGNYDLLCEAEVYLTMIPAMLAERGVGEYTDTIRELESRYDRAVASIDDLRGGWKVARMELRYIRKEMLTIALKEDLIVLSRDMVSMNSMNNNLQDPEN